jgi:hypothetical protein
MAEDTKEKMKKGLKKGCLKRLIAIGILGAWALATHNYDPKPVDMRYNLPAEICVQETNLPFHTREVKKKVKTESGIEEKVVEEKFVNTSEIDFSEDFDITTERYHFVKDKDWLPSRIIGHTFSIPGKILFMDWNYGWGQDADRTKAALSMIEENKEIKDLTIRLNHNEAFYDMYRMFTEDKLTERNNFFARATLGTLLSLGNEIWAEFSRGSYYNPFTKTVVCYSNIESITGHEIGHHQDFQRFDSDWLYMLGRTLPPITLYQEWQASTNAQDKILSKDDSWQFNRYLMPAFGTYVLASWFATKRFYKKYLAGKD